MVLTQGWVLSLPVARMNDRARVKFSVEAIDRSTCIQCLLHRRNSKHMDLQGFPFPIPENLVDT